MRKDLRPNLLELKSQIPMLKQLTKPKTKFSPEITEYVYYSLDREKRKGSRD